MTNGQNNPNNMPDEDWAMSEPEIPVKKEIQAKPIDEKAASLYAPPDTGDLEEWDIATQDVNLSDDAIPPSPPSSPPPQEFSEPAVFTPPPNTFEVLKPVPPPKVKDDDWGMNAPNIQNDGWKMPEPIYRATEGEILTKVRSRSPKSNTAAPVQSAQTQESLPDIYAPPDTEESLPVVTEVFNLADLQEEMSEEMDFSSELPIETDVSPQLPETAPVPVERKKWSFLIWGLLLAGLFVIIIGAAVLAWFFYANKLIN